MTRTVLTFERLGTTQTMLKLDAAPGVFAGQGDNVEVDLSTMPQGTLQERGAALVDLLRAHQAVRDGLAAVLALPVGADPSPVYFRVRASSADLVPWEQLYAEPHGFCALDRRWPIGRIASEQVPIAPRAFTAPLRLVAVLSAAGRDGMPQLKALLAACTGAPVPVQLHVISGDENVLTAATSSGATAELISPSSPGLARQIVSARPHLLHVLCHGGGSPAGVRVLAFASSVDVDQLEPAPGDLGSIRMPVNDLLGALLPCNPWLVVLASCQSADAGDEHEGVAAAHQLVCAGVPAVIGMRRLVDLTDTDRFCAALYPEVLDVVARTVACPAVPGQPNVQTLDWAQVLTAPRVAMAGVDPAQLDAWTDPVLYAQQAPMELFLPLGALTSDDFIRLRGRIDKLRGGLSRLDPATADAGLIEELQARIAELEAELRAAGG